MLILDMLVRVLGRLPFIGEGGCRKNVPENEAVEALIDLIKSEGSWVDP